MFENHVDGDFNDNWDKMELDKTWEHIQNFLHSLQCLKLILMYMLIFNEWNPLISIKNNSNKGNFSFLYTK